MDKQFVKPLFHYLCKSEATILDSQYSYDGDYMAIATSNGSIFLFRTQSDDIIEVEDQLPAAEFHNKNKNNSFIKLAWSYGSPPLLAASTIDRQIVCFQIAKKKEQPASLVVLALNKINEKKFDYIATHLAWFPSTDTSLLSVGFSNGMIYILEANLSVMTEQIAHEESVNWLSWEHDFNNSSRNNWISTYFPSSINSLTVNKGVHYLATGSSDSHIKIWTLCQNFRKSDIHMLSPEPDVPQFELHLEHTISVHSRQIRQVMWKPNFFCEGDSDQTPTKHLVSCSEDGFVRFLQINVAPDGKVSHKQNSNKAMKGPVFRAQYNHLGSMIAISYRNDDDERVKTELYKDNGGRLGEEIMIKR